MKNNKKIMAVIPARKGSKGIKDKNIKLLKGKPLIAYSIEAGLNSKYIDKVIVSTDGEEIANIAKTYGAEVPFLRPKNLSTDTAKTIDAVVHCIDELKKRGEIYDYIVLLQPTQPLRQSWHIDEAIELIFERNEDALVSVSEVRDNPILIRSIDENGYTKNLLKECSTRRRQDFDIYYRVNGAIYINKINESFNKSTSLNDNKLAYIMDSSYDVDIDDLNDFKIAELFIDN